MTPTFNRRRFLRGVGLLGASVAASGLAAPYLARGASAPIRIVSNPGLENATLNALMDELGYFKRFGVNAQIVDIPGVHGPLDAMAAGAGDVCMVSGYNLVLSRIAHGARVKIVGAGMKRCALTVFARPDGATTLADLKHKTVAVGPERGLLHSLMVQLLKARGIDYSQVRFVDKGSNDDCHAAVVKGEVDASCSSISHLNDRDGLVVINDGNMWQALPHCIFQTAYASDDAIRNKHDDMVAVMAAYGALYEFLMSPDSRDAFFAARKHAQKRFDAESAQAIWQFNETQRPYSKDLSLTEADIAYLQDMYIGLGSLDRKQDFAEVADMSAAREAAKLLG
ncbi:NitT/TauT family transport system substrate-binding protein [Paraburkholderia tropica]|uniref:ABC transporter substrate-binding protein n=1 Tax=Paraburkholderia tropica TaxID=92647 RepID=UPI00161DD22A|nr:ABC transporter substrate-binding protein [Paraburkholderia tropica]MBB3003929.1 NitT/TauT family transport system substrate-binding protein [Paraburkholderia tropica]MBB6322773.1 NitT/TauT family transport system substrate-binding protein [Paraburkholderia tropica]